MFRLSLLQVTTFVCLSITCTCFGVIAYSRSRPNLNEPLEFALCEGSPCFLEIVPGQTNRAYAESALNQFTTRVGAEDASFSIIPSEDGQLVNAIYIEPAIEENISLTTILSVYGTPACIEIYRPTGRIILHYPAMHVHAQTQFDGNHLSPHTSVRSVVLGNPNPYATQIEPCKRPDLDAPGQERATTILHWSGFSTMRGYFEN